MKKDIKYIYGAFAILALLIMSGCEIDDASPVSIKSISEDAVYQGQPVSLTGEGFDQVQYVFVNYDQVEYTMDGNTITFTIPDNAPVGMATVTLAMKGDVRETHEFEVLLKPVPVIQSFDPFVPVGSDLTIVGTGLDNSTQVTIDGVPASIVSASDTELVVTVPDGINTSSAVGFEITTTFGSSTPSTAFYARENELANSDLSLGEGDEFTDWEILNPGTGITAVTGEAAYGRGRSMRVVGTGGNPWDAQVASTGVQLDFGEQYTIVLWAKGEAAGAQMRVSVSQWDGNGADYFYGETVDLSTNWEQYTWTFTVTNDLPTHRVVLDMGMTNVPFIIDHIGLAPGSLGSVGSPELLANPGFEDALDGSWRILNGDFDLSTSEAYCGSQSLTATGTGGNPWDIQLASEPVALEVGTDYELGFWAKAAGPDGVMRVSASQWASGQSDDFFYSPDVTIAEDWTYYSFIFTAQATSTGDHSVVLDFGATTQTFFLDEISLKEYQAPESAYANGGFEDGMTGWNILNSTAEATTAEAYEGSSSLTATGTGGNPWDVQIASDAVVLSVDSQYKISFWAKAAGPDGIFRISMSQWASGQSDDFFYSRDLTISEDWTYYSFVVTAQPTSTGDHRLLFDLGASTQTFFIDNVIVAEYDGACE